MAMEEDRSRHALARIEAALQRIESAAQASRTRPDQAELVQLQSRHDRLRAAVQESMQLIDELIEGARG